MSKPSTVKRKFAMKYPQELRERAFAMVDQGLPVTKVAARLKVDASSIWSWRRQATRAAARATVSKEAETRAAAAPADVAPAEVAASAAETRLQRRIDILMAERAEVSATRYETMELRTQVAALTAERDALLQQAAQIPGLTAERDLLAKFAAWSTTQWKP